MQAENSTSSGYTRNELRRVIWPEDSIQRKAYDPRFVAAFGPEAGIMLGQLVFWSDKTKEDHDGWLWKSIPELQRETGLSRRQQDKARKILVGKGIVEEERRGVPCRMHYRVCFEELIATLNLDYSLPGITEQTSMTTNTEQSSLTSNSEQTSSPGITERAIQREPERTSEITSLEDAPDKNQKGKNLKEPEEQGDTQPDKRHSEDPPAPPNKTADEVEDDLLDEIPDLCRGIGQHPYESDPEPERSPKPVRVAEEPRRRRDAMYEKVLAAIEDPETDAGRVARRCLEGRLEPDKVCDAICHQWYGSSEGSSMFADRVERALAELREREAVPVAV